MLYALSVILMILAGAAFVIFDLAVGVAHSDGWTMVVLGMGFVFAFLPAMRPRRSIKVLMCSVALFAVFSSGIVAFRKLEDDSPIQKFHKVYWNIHAGMSTAQVEALVAREFRSVRPSIRWHPGVGYLGLEPVDRDYDAEFIEIRLDRGVVVSTEYLPD